MNKMDAPHGGHKRGAEERQPLFVEDYEIIRLLGKGSFGSVYIVRSKHDASVMCVMKKVNVHNLSERVRLPPLSFSPLSSIILRCADSQSHFA